jgi:hypothetical protein
MGDFVRILFLFLLLSSCKNPVEFIHCPPNSGSNGIEIAHKYFYSPALDRVDIYCRTREELPKNVDCQYLWYGSSAIYRGRMEVNRDLIDACIVHEAYHAYIWELTADSCHGHDLSCGWNYDTLEIALDELEKL